jgi:hypothetical protein
MSITECTADFLTRNAENYKELTFLFAFLGAIVASLGLTTNSVSTIIGSMLLSPVGAIIIKGILQCYLSQYHKLDSEKIFGFANNLKPGNFDLPLLGRISVPNRWWWLEVIVMIVIVIITGWIIGMAWIGFSDPVDEETGERREIINSLPTNEMKERAKMSNALVMIPIAIIGGVALPYALRRNSTTKLLGISIATALLPPLANIGLALSYQTLGVEFTEEQTEEYSVTEALGTGTVIFLINFVLLLMCAGLSIKFICSQEMS